MTVFFFEKKVGVSTKVATELFNVLWEESVRYEMPACAPFDEKNGRRKNTCTMSAFQIANRNMLSIYRVAYYVCCWGKKRE